MKLGRLRKWLCERGESSKRARLEKVLSYMPTVM
jgi:hypothetical protein